MKDAFYFSHDYGARNDPKIKAMMLDYGREGYGWFWILIETLAEQKDYMLPVKKWAYASLASDFDCPLEKAQQYIQQCIDDYELLATDGNSFWSESLLRRMVVRENKKQMAVERASKAGQASAAKRELNTSSDNDADDSTNVQHESNTSSTDVQQNPTKERKGKERKEYSPDSIEFRLANLLLEKIREWHPEYNPDVDLHKWADYVRLMQKPDKRTPSQIQDLILWCQSDSFWRKNILSTAKLREQWNTLTAQMISQKQPRAAPNKDPAAFYNDDETGENAPWA